MCPGLALNPLPPPSEAGAEGAECHGGPQHTIANAADYLENHCNCARLTIMSLSLFDMLSHVCVICDRVVVDGLPNVHF
jgi:hypothetical protein